MPRQHRYLSDMMAELELTMRPLVANYVFLNTYFFLEATPDANISTDFIIARFRRRASIQHQLSTSPPMARGSGGGAGGAFPLTPIPLRVPSMLLAPPGKC